MSVNVSRPWGRLGVGRLRALGGAAVLELSLRGIGGTTLADLLELVAQGLLVSLALAFTNGWVGQTLATVATWALYAYLLYSILPGLFPDELQDLATDRRFVGLLAMGAVLHAIPVRTALAGLRQLLTGATGAEAPTFPVYDIVLMLVWWSSVIWLYLRFGREGSIGTRGTATRRLLTIIDDEIDETLSRPPQDRSVRDWFDVGTAIVNPGIMFGVLTFALGLMVAVLWTLYPLPELLFATAGVLGLVVARTDLIDRRINLRRDLETDISAAVVTIIRSRRGIGIAITTILGIVGTFFVFLTGLFRISQSIGPVREAVQLSLTRGIGPSKALLESSARIGAGVTLIVSAVLMLWVWVQLSRRSSAFVEAIDAEPVEARAETVDVAVSRPTGGVLLPAVLSATALPFALLPDSALPLETVYGRVWPMGLVLAGVWVGYSIRQESQPPASDHGSHVISFVGTVGQLGFIGLYAPWYTTDKWHSGDILMLFIAMGALVFVYYEPDIKQRLETASHPWRRFSEGATPGILSIAMFLVSFISPMYRPIVLPAALLAAVTAVIGIYFERGSTREQAE